ncbi:mitochondrial carrier [Rhizodiscina lignyota]|uniref:Mitochondrial carrier n=1 Tax=Rhizodiscina lignyota TaxID=1504668 RepID=A0A9P4I6W5_9PEZI|nr:mitochondrial carrier [Rhizodiscina lignyota]
MSASVAPVKAVAKDKSIEKKRIHYPFWFGGSASCFAACVTHPLDLVKVRLQTQHHGGPRRNMLQMFVHVFQNDGIRGLYRGLSASLLRQLTYSTTRFGVYEELKEVFTSARSKPSFATLVAMASTSGFLGGLAGNPADVLNVRMQHDAALPPAERRNYKNAVEGLVRMARDEGMASLWKGVWPNSIRAVLMTASQLASYDIFKRLLLEHTTLKDNLTTHFSASFMAGFVATTICSPVDVIKTRVMSAKESKNILVLLTEVTKNEGWTWMFRGWVPSFIRLGPHTIATFLFLEQHKKIYRRTKGLE